MMGTPGAGHFFGIGGQRFQAVDAAPPSTGTPLKQRAFERLGPCSHLTVGGAGAAGAAALGTPGAGASGRKTSPVIRSVLQPGGSTCTIAWYVEMPPMLNRQRTVLGSMTPAELAAPAPGSMVISPRALTRALFPASSRTMLQPMFRYV